MATDKGILRFPLVSSLITINFEKKVGTRIVIYFSFIKVIPLFLILGQLVRLTKRPPPKKKNQEESRTRTPSTPASLLWSLEAIRHGYKINMAAMDVKEDEINVAVKIKQKHGEKEEPPKLL